MGLLVTWVYVRLYGESFAPVVDMMLWGLPVGLLLSRMGYVLTHWTLYVRNPYDILCLWYGGLSLYGAAMGFLLGIWVYCRKHDLSLWYWLDILMPAIVCGLAIHQLGIFFMQMTVGLPLPPGLPNDHSLAEYIEYSYRPSGFENYEYFKPIALYQAGCQFLIFMFVCITAYRQSQNLFFWRDGCVFLLGVFLLALVRFVCGFFYLSTIPMIAFHTGQILSAMLALVCVGFFVRRRRRTYFHWK